MFSLNFLSLNHFYTLLRKTFAIINVDQLIIDEQRINLRGKKKKFLSLFFNLSRAVTYAILDLAQDTFVNHVLVKEKKKEKR